MRKLLILFILLAINQLFWGQEQDAKKLFVELNTSFNNASDNYDKIINNLDTLKQRGSTGRVDSLTRSLDSLKTLIRTMDEIHKNASSNKIHFINEESINADSIDTWAGDVLSYEPGPESETKSKVYTYFDKNTIIEENVFDKNIPQHKILNRVLTQESETYFGDLTIPKENQEFSFYSIDDYKIRKDTIYRFKKVAIEINDGNFNDIKVYVEYNGSIHIFSNRISIGLLRFSTRAKDNYLFYNQSIVGSKKLELDEMKKNCIRLGDVVVYDYEIGNHFIPNNLALKLPGKDIDGKKTNENSPATYQIKQETDLNKIVELRTYSDFLALFGDSDNGLVQIEGKAKFYIFPYPIQVCKWPSEYEILSSVSPHVNYSRFADKSRYVKLNQDKDSVASALNLVEKRFLTMGAELNAFKLRSKYSPVELNLYGFADYQLTEANLGNDSIPNVKTIKAVSYGVGGVISAKRLNNFEFNIRFEYSWYNYRGFNTFENLKLPQKVIPVFRNEAEIAYHPTSSANSAIFLRLTTYNNMLAKNNEAFYQFQFGYKFAVGDRTVD